MANYDFKIGDRVHHSKHKPTKGYDCFIAGFSKDGESVVLGNVEGGHNGKDTFYLYNENGDYVGYSLLTKASGYYFVETEGLRKLHEKVEEASPQTLKNIIENDVKSKTTLMSSSKTIKVNQNF